MNRELDCILEELCENGVYVGLSLLVAQEGNIVYRKEVGWSDKENKKKIAPDTIFNLYSMTKPIIAAATMCLWESGKLDLMDSVSKYLPAYRNQKVREEGQLVNAKREVTIRDLLNMTSGIPYPGSKDTPEVNILYKEAMEKAISREALDTITFVNRLAEVPLVHQPGELWQYGASADVLGAIIEVITGQKLGEYLQKLFFEPLEMVDTAFYVPKQKKQRLNVIYKMEKEKNPAPYHERDLVIMDYETNPAFQSGGAGLFSTMDDYFKFTSMLRQEGIYQGKRYLNKKTVHFMRQNQLNSQQKKGLNWTKLDGYGYGCLMRVLENPIEACTISKPGEFGWDGRAGTYMEIHPKEQVEIILMTGQIGQINDYYIRRIRNLIYRNI